MSEKSEQYEAPKDPNSALQENPGSEGTDFVPTVLPLEIIDRAIGKQVHVILTSEKEFKGTLVGFDDFVNMVLENVEEVGDSSGERRERMLLNGGHVAMIVPS